MKFAFPLPLNDLTKFVMDKAMTRMKGIYLATLMVLLTPMAAHAVPLIDYKITGDLTANAGDSAGLDNANITFAALFDSADLYVNRFGFAALPADSASMTFSGAANAANDGLFGFTSAAAFYPTFAGTFAEPAGLQLQFFTGTGVLMDFFGNTTPSAGAADAVIGGVVELDDFVPSTFTGNFTNSSNGETYTLSNVVISAVIQAAVPEPGTIALFGLGLAGVGFAKRKKA